MKRSGSTYTNDTSKLIRSGTYRFLSLNDSASSDEFSRVMIRKMVDGGLSTSDEKHWTLGDLFWEFKRGNVNVYPDYQRGLVTHVEWARELVSVCIFTSAPIAPIYLNKNRESGHYDVVDGSQRLAAYFAFMMGGFPVIDVDNSEQWFCDSADKDHWGKVLWCLDEGGVEAFLSEEPASPNLAIFEGKAKALWRRQGSFPSVLDCDAKARLLGRKQSIVVMPDTWDQELCILYVVYTGLKSWRQTKDECLVHLYDRASRELKPMEGDLERALRACGIRVPSPTRQLYGVVVRVFAVMDEFPHVPVESDERLYIDLMLEMVRRYASRDPDPETLWRVRRGIALLESGGGDLKAKLNTLLNRKRGIEYDIDVSADSCAVLLYTVCFSGTLGNVPAVVTLTGKGAARNRAARLSDIKIRDVDVLMDAYREANSKKNGASVNLSSVCAVAAGLGA